MSPHDIPAVPPDATPPRFYPLDLHPEFGYFAPTLRLRRKAGMIGKGILVGAVIGAGAMFALSPDRDARVRSVFDMQTLAAAGEDTAPIRYVAPTLAMPAAGGVAVEPSTGAIAAEPAVAAPAVRKAAPKPKVARQPQRERTARPAEPDARNAHAGPFRRPAEPPSAWNGRRPFGFGW